MVMGGFKKNLFTLVNIDVLGEEKLKGLRQQMRKTDQMAGKAGNQLNNVAGSADDVADSSQRAGGQFGKMFGVGMNLMFMGMALQQVFGGLAGSMMKMVGVSQMFGAAAKSVLLPFFLEIAPVLFKIATFFMQLPRSVKMVIGAFVALLAVMGTLMFFGAQLALLAIALGVSILSVFAAAATLAAGILGVISVIVAVSEIFRKWGKQVGAVAAIIIASLALIVAAATTAPIVIGAAIAASFAALLTAVWHLRSEIMGVIDAIFNYFVDTTKQRIRQLKNIFNGLKTFFSGIGEILGGNFKDGFKEVLKGLGTVITEAINFALPFGLTLDKISRMLDSGAGAVGSVIGVNDFILTSGGKVLQPSANDTIVGFNGNGPIQPGAGGGGQVTVNINDPVMKEDVDVERVVDEVEERVNRDTRGRTGLGT